MGEKLGHGPSILRIFDQTPVNEVAKVARPSLIRYRGMRLAYNSLELPSLIQYVCKWGIAGSQLVCEASEGPDIDFFRVLDLLGDLGGVEGNCSCLGLCRVIPLREKLGQAKVSDLDFALA